MKMLLVNIHQLLQVRENPPSVLSGNEMKQLPLVENAWLAINNGIIEGFGPMSEAPADSKFEVIDCSGKIVLPAWCDSHTHLVFAGNREGEFVDRINGLSYQEIANKGGGILNSAKKLQDTSEEDLYNQSEKRLQEIIQQGTGAVEIKSGYGLTLEAEIKMLRVARKLDENYPVAVVTTFLGAHAVPEEFKENRQDYVNLVCDEMLPQVSELDLADYIDVFCEKGYFSTEDTSKILSAGKKFGLRGKIHVNQFTALGGVATGVENDALSVDHLEVLTENDLEALKGSSTIPVALPGCSFFLGIPYTPGRKIIDSGLPLALATDYNPGSAPSGNMNFVVAAACIKMNLTPEEAINAATLNGAYAMGLSDQLGSVTVGKTANLLITKTIPSYGYIPYSFGSNLVESVILRGSLR